jgi:hypothetical protein
VDEAIRVRNRIGAARTHTEQVRQFRKGVPALERRREAPVHNVQSIVEIIGLHLPSLRADADLKSCIAQRKNRELAIH